MIEGDPGSSNALNRGKGFKEGLAKHPNLNLVASQTAKWDTDQGAGRSPTPCSPPTPTSRRSTPRTTAWRLGVQAAIDAKGLTGKVLLVGTDGIPQAKKQIAGRQHDRHRQRTADHRRRQPACDAPCGCSPARRCPAGWTSRRSSSTSTTSPSTRPACREPGPRTGPSIRTPTMTAALLEISNVAKSFPGVRALDEVSFTSGPRRGPHPGRGERRRQEHAARDPRRLPRPDRGTVTIDGVRRDEYSPRQALAEGVDRAPGAGDRAAADRRAEPAARQDRRRAARAADASRALADVAAMGFPLDPTAPAVPAEPGPAARPDDRQGVRLRRQDRRPGRTDHLDAGTQRGGRPRPGAAARATSAESASSSSPTRCPR